MSANIDSNTSDSQHRVDLAGVRASPNVLAPHYSRFKVTQRTLLTGHSHQAWPDCALEGLTRCFQDAAEHADDKWGRAFETAERVRRGIAVRTASVNDASVA